MSTIPEVLTSLSEGAIDAATAGQQIGEILNASEGDDFRPAPDAEDYGNVALQRMADKDDTGFENSFNLVTVAWMSGELTDGQYYTIRDAAVPQKKEETDD